ncbi:hypothetical protein V6N13_128429 [Hibiscus sabdariffa]
MDLSHGDIVHVKHGPILVPEDSVIVEILCRVEPEIEPFFPAPLFAPVAEKVCLYNPLFPRNVPEELEVKFVVVAGEDIGVCRVERGDDAGGVVIVGEFNGSTEKGITIKEIRFEPGTCRICERYLDICTVEMNVLATVYGGERFIE